VSYYQGLEEEPDLFSKPDSAQQRADDLWDRHVQAWRLLAVIQAKLGEMGKAKGMLTQWESGMIERRQRAAAIRKRHAKSGPGQRWDWTWRNEENFVFNMPFAEATYYTARGEVALALGRKLDALQFFVTAMRHEAESAPGQKTRAAAGAKKLWSDLGGTREGWRALHESLKPASM
jgi:hypothetical protein